MCNKYISLFLFVFICACSSKVKEEKKSDVAKVEVTNANYWIQKSLDFHDPNNVFDKTEIVADIRSTTVRDTTERLREVAFNTVQGVFEMRQKTDSTDIVYQVPVPKAITDTLKIERSNMYQDYFRYMLGGAMVLSDEAAIIQEAVKDTMYNKRRAKYITVQYEPIGETPNWYFTIDTETGEMLQSRFVYNEGKEDQRGEFINYGPYVDYKGMKITSKLEWYYLNGDSLAIEKITYL